MRCFFPLLLMLLVSPALAQTGAPPPHQTFALFSKILDEPRVINVWTPPGFTGSRDSMFFLYMPDGGMAEDFPHVAETVAQLVAAKEIPPVILIGIENTQRRRDLTPPTDVAADKEIAPVVGGSAKFRAFIQEELFPEIARRYPAPGRKGIIGESLAGLFIMETFLLQPELFDAYIALDPSLWWNRHKLVRHAGDDLKTFPKSIKRLYLAASNTKDIKTHTAALAKVLKLHVLQQLTWTYNYEPREKHNTIYRAVKEKALRWTLGGRSVPLN